MTVCEACEQLCNGLGPYCAECRSEFEEMMSTCPDCNKDQCECEYIQDERREDECQSPGH